jgi:hypothetical protein
VKVMMWIVLVLGAFVLLNETLDIISDWLDAIRAYRRGWRVK